MSGAGQIPTIVPVVSDDRRTGTPNPDATTAAAPRRSRRGGRLVQVVQAAVILAVILTAGTRALAAPVGPIDVAGKGTAATTERSAIGAARLGYGIDGQGRVDRVLVHRDGGDPTAPATVVLTDGHGAPLATVTTVLQGPDAVVILPTAVDPALVAGASLKP
jgi:hypothetical protein